jgi:hypothetical protein
MTGIVVGQVVPALDNPEPSASKLGRAYGERLKTAPLATVPDEKTVDVVPGLSKARMAARHGPETAYAPRWMTGSFRVPYGMREAQLVAHCKEMAARWFEEMGRRGFDLVNSTMPQVNPGPNPSKDLATGLTIPGHRDFLIQAQFIERHPETMRLELPSDLFEAWRPSQLPKSSDEED